MPAGCFILQSCGAHGLPELRLQWVFPGLLGWRAFQSAIHSPGAPGFEQIVFIWNLSNFIVACWHLGTDSSASKTPTGSTTWCFSTIIWWLAIVYFEICPPEIRSKEVAEVEYKLSKKGSNSRREHSRRSLFHSFCTEESNRWKVSYDLTKKVKC